MATSCPGARRWSGRGRGRLRRWQGPGGPGRACRCRSSFVSVVVGGECAGVGLVVAGSCLLVAGAGGPGAGGEVLAAATGAGAGCGVLVAVDVAAGLLAGADGGGGLSGEHLLCRDPPAAVLVE